MLSLISALPTGSALSWEPSCWPLKSGMTRLCGMSTTARSLKTSLWRTCKFVLFLMFVFCFMAKHTENKEDVDRHLFESQVISVGRGIVENSLHFK